MPAETCAADLTNSTIAAAMAVPTRPAIPKSASTAGSPYATAIARMKGGMTMSDGISRAAATIVEVAAEEYRQGPDGLRAAVLRSGVEIVPVLDRVGASDELALAAAAAVSAGLFQMIASEMVDNQRIACYRTAYFQLIARGIDRMAQAQQTVQ